MRMRSVLLVVVVPAVLVLFSILPFLLAMLASVIADANGCVLHEGFANPCIVGGDDIGELLGGLFVAGWLTLITVPVGTVALILWFTAIAILKIRRLRSRDKRE